MMKLLRSKTAKNAHWLIGGRLVNKAVAFLVGLLTARYLGSTDFGLISYATAYTTFFASICTLGINSVIIKNFFDHPEEKGEAIGTAVGMRMLSSLLSAVMIVGVVAIVDRGEPLTIAVVALSCIELLPQAFDTFKQWFQARLESRYAAIASILATAVASVYKFVLLAVGASVYWFALSLAVDYVVIAGVLFAIYKRQGGPKLSFSWKKGKELLTESYSFIISGLMIAVYASADKFMLKHLMDEASVSFYTLALSVSTVYGFVLDAIIQSMTPAVIESYKSDRSVFLRRNRQMYAIVIYISFAGAILIGIFAKPLVEVAYGYEYLGVIAPLRIVSWCTAFSYLGVARNVWLVCEGRQKYQNVLYAVAAVTNVVLNLILIPKLGASGAAIATLVTQVMTGILLPALMPPLRENAKLILQAICLKNIT
ncbi:MAG: flippase [Clostridia bacterium]|nr:flippase [Clostridia bacterium]